MPDDSRDVLLLFYREGNSSRQVAALLGLSDGTVRKRLQRARDALQNEWLAQVAEASRHSAPGLAFTTLVVGSLGPRDAAAVTGDLDHGLEMGAGRGWKRSNRARRGSGRAMD